MGIATSKSGTGMVYDEMVLIVVLSKIGGVMMDDVRVNSRV